MGHSAGPDQGLTIALVDEPESDPALRRAATECLRWEETLLQKAQAVVDRRRALLERIPHSRYDSKLPIAEVPEQGTIKFRNPAERKKLSTAWHERLKTAEERLSKMQADESLRLPILPAQFVPGAIGMLAGPVSVAQIEDGSTMMVTGAAGAEPRFSIEQPTWPEDPPFMDFKVGDEYRVFLEGVDTSELSDDEVVQRDELFEVVGNRSYTDALGAKRTIFVLRAIDATGLADLVNNKRGRRDGP